MVTLIHISIIKFSKSEPPLLFQSEDDEPAYAQVLGTCDQVNQSSHIKYYLLPFTCRCRRVHTSPALAQQAAMAVENNWFGEDQKEMQKTCQRIIDEVECQLNIMDHLFQDINPFVTEWEEAGAYPAHKV